MRAFNNHGPTCGVQVNIIFLQKTESIRRYIVLIRGALASAICITKISQHAEKSENRLSNIWRKHLLAIARNKMLPGEKPEITPRRDKRLRETIPKGICYPNKVFEVVNMRLENITSKLKEGGLDGSHKRNITI